ncbi:MAG: hypothetical protein L6R42_004549 [Xanthoria sp. 1 TBL-2021]|nr:MAG: hypothetical protein L6R42_004549 [Xanthoria sp. 1 TBL-2021]
MSRYKYTPLDPQTKTTRLLSLRPGSFDNEIHVSLGIMHLTDNDLPDYEALSYTWGSRDDPVDIWVADLPTDADPMGEGQLPVTQNLAVALRYLRSEESTRDIWIDAICVDQQNLGERGHQVELMGDIYQKAKRVLVWLGPESEDSALAIGTLISISSWVEV